MGKKNRYFSREFLHLVTEYGMTPSMSRSGNCYDNVYVDSVGKPFEANLEKQRVAISGFFKTQNPTWDTVVSRSCQRE